MKASILVFLAIGAPLVLGQIGVKTKQHIPSGSLVFNTTYGGGYPSYHPTYPTPDERTIFLNKTFSKIPPGVCFTEVPTSSLVKDPSLAPVGNGSDPSYSKIQVCCEGYERNPHNFYKCDPVCENECTNGICVRPNVCECYPDHVLNLAGYCLPTCPIGCGNGHCKPDGSCECEQGYALHESRKFCVPVCKTSCQYGNCTTPGNCECKTGYISSPDGDCVPKCDNCDHGRCTAPDVCECYPGYAKTSEGCEPVCSTECANGFCSGPNKCSCNEGFTLQNGGCVAEVVCNPPCLNGFCAGPNQCMCNPGYALGSQPNICSPHCDGGCPNGFCASPNFCICNLGYIKNRSVKGREVCVPLQ